MDDLARDSMELTGLSPIERAHHGQALAKFYAVHLESPGYYTNFIGSDLDPEQLKLCFLETVGDMLCDLLHLAEYVGMRPDDLYDQAERHWRAERSD
jgi:hypothetical protein